MVNTRCSVVPRLVNRMAGCHLLLVMFIVLLGLILPVVVAHDSTPSHPHDGIATLPPNVQRMIDQQTQVALGISLLAAFLAGIISFTSPCGFVLVPGFFAVAFRDKKKSLTMASLFSLGLMFAFVMFGIIAGVTGSFFNQYKTDLAWWSGLALVVFGFMTLFNIGLGRLNLHLGGRPPVKSFLGMFFFGFVFAIGWAPCIGAILAGILLLATVAGGLIKSALLLFAFGSGVVLPLLIVAGLSDRYDVARRIQGRVWSFNLGERTIQVHSYNLCGGVVLIILGIAIMISKGSRLIEILVTEYTPWSMNFFISANEWLTTFSFSGSNLAGILIVIGVIAIMALGIHRLPN